MGRQLNIGFKWSSLNNMIDLLYFRLCSVSLGGGNHTVLDIGNYTDNYITSIEVLHEEFGKSGIPSKGIPFSEWITSVNVRPGWHLTSPYIILMHSILLNFDYVNL